MPETQTAKTPRHLWIIGFVALIWNLIGAMDYVMTETKNEAYMSQFSEQQLEFFYNFPAWLIAFWAVAVWGGVLGSILLLMRKKLAYPVFLVSFLCMIVTTIHNYGFAGAADVVGGAGVFFSLVIFLVALVLVIYSKRMAARGVLT